MTITTDAEKTLATDAQPSETETKPKKPAKGGKPGKKVKPSKKAAAGKPAAERSNKKADVIAMMKRAKGATLAEIMEATGWQKHTVRGFVSILGNREGRRSNPRRTLRAVHTSRTRNVPAA